MNNISLTPELVAQIKALVESGAVQLTDPRITPMGPLKNLNHDPAQKYVPTYFWSVGARDVPAEWDTTATFPFPRLLWDVNGVEICVHDQKEMDAKVAAGYLLVSPMQKVETDDERFEREFALLAPEDQQLLLSEIKRVQTEKLRDMASSMSPAKLQSLTKRGPGRPRKAVNE
jgi:hypothetical protein